MAENVNHPVQTDIQTDDKKEEKKMTNDEIAESMGFVDELDMRLYYGRS